MKLADLPVRAVEKGHITFRNKKGRACTPKALGLIVEEKTRARASDPETSREAAGRVGEFAQRHFDQILAAFVMRGGMTIYEIAEATGLDHVAVARRMPEMAKPEVGLVRVVLKDGKPVTRRTPSGRNARVWEIA